VFIRILWLLELELVKYGELSKVVFEGLQHNQYISITHYSTKNIPKLNFSEFYLQMVLPARGLLLS